MTALYNFCQRDRGIGKSLNSKFVKTFNVLRWRITFNMEEITNTFRGTGNIDADDDMEACVVDG